MLTENPLARGYAYRIFFFYRRRPPLVQFQIPTRLRCDPQAAHRTIRLRGDGQHSSTAFAQRVHAVPEKLKAHLQ
jgi:hypothetical protein